MDFKRYIHAHSDELLASLAALVRIPSVEGEPEEGAPFGKEPARCLHEMLALCEKLGFPTENMDDRVGWCEYGEGEEMVAVLGHLDVVPAGDGWTESEPFSGEIKNGRIYGRGTMDDKGPMVAAVYALAALKQSGFQPSRRIRVIFGTNEETGCGDMAWYASHGGEMPVMGFTPDGEYPLINGEKGILNSTYTRTLHQTGDYILTRFEGGEASNISPAYAVAEVKCPVEAASKIAAEKVTVTPIDGGIRVEAEGLAMRDGISGDLTMNVGVASFENEALSLTFSVRYPVTLPYELVYPRLKRGFTLGGFTETEMTHAAALYIPKDSELIRRLLGVYEAETGEKAEPKCIGGGTYAKSMPNIVAFGPIFPGDEVREHKPDEYMETRRVIQNAKIIASAMKALAE